MANIRRGLERIGKVLMMWGIFVTGIGIYNDPVDDVEKIMVAIIAWVPFILFKLLAWVGSSFFDEE